MEEQTKTQLLGKNLFREFWIICMKNDMCAGGGPHTRVQPQPNKNHVMVKQCKYTYIDGTIQSSLSDTEINTILSERTTILELALQDLNDGKYLTSGESGGWIEQNGPKDLSMVGDISLISFASLSVFTGLATSTVAISTAKQALPNFKNGNGNSTNSYWNSLASYLNIEENKDTGNYDNITVTQILSWFNAVAIKIGSVIVTVENTICEVFRKKEVIEAYFYGQEIYNIFDQAKNALMVKKFGNTDWELLNP